MNNGSASAVSDKATPASVSVAPPILDTDTGFRDVDVSPASAAGSGRTKKTTSADKVKEKAKPKAKKRAALEVAVALDGVDADVTNGGPRRSSRNLT